MSDDFEAGCGCVLIILGLALVAGLLFVLMYIVIAILYVIFYGVLIGASLIYLLLQIFLGSLPMTLGATIITLIILYQRERKRLSSLDFIEYIKTKILPDFDGSKIAWNQIGEIEVTPAKTGVFFANIGLVVVGVTLWLLPASGINYGLLLLADVLGIIRGIEVWYGSSSDMYEVGVAIFGGVILSGIFMIATTVIFYKTQGKRGKTSILINQYVKNVKDEDRKYMEEARDKYRETMDLFNRTSNIVKNNGISYLIDSLDELNLFLRSENLFDLVKNRQWGGYFKHIDKIKREIELNYQLAENYVNDDGSFIDYDATGGISDEEQAFIILGLAPTASVEEIKKRFRELAMQFHPDKATGADEEFKKRLGEQFRKIKEAYEFLKEAKGIS